MSLHYEIPKHTSYSRYGVTMIPGSRIFFILIILLCLLLLIQPLNADTTSQLSGIPIISPIQLSSNATFNETMQSAEEIVPTSSGQSVTTYPSNASSLPSKSGICD